MPCPGLIPYVSACCNARDCASDCACASCIVAASSACASVWLIPVSCCCAAPLAPVPFNHFPRAAEPVQKFARRTAGNPAPRAEPAVQSVKGRIIEPVKAHPVLQHAALSRLAPAQTPPVQDMPASVRQSAQAAPAAPPPASVLIPVKRPLGRPRKVAPLAPAPLAPAEIADIVQAHLPDTQPAANPAPVAEAIAQTRTAQEAAQRGPDPAQSRPGRSFGAPSAPLTAKAHQPLCAYSAQVRTLATEAEIAAAAQALGADDVVVLRQVDRLRRLGGHSRTLCATDDVAVDRLTKAGLVVVLPWNGPKPPEPPCYAELTPAGAAVLALCTQPARSASQESDETVKTLQRYVEPRKTGRPPGRD